MKYTTLEEDVLEYYEAGYTAEEIADKLDLTVHDIDLTLYHLEREGLIDNDEQEEL